MYAERKGWRLDKLKVSVVRAAGADAHESRALEKTIAVEGDLDEARRQRLHEIADRCPVHLMLAKGVEIESSMA